MLKDNALQTRSICTTTHVHMKYVVINVHPTINILIYVLKPVVIHFGDLVVAFNL